MTTTPAARVSSARLPKLLLAASVAALLAGCSSLAYQQPTMAVPATFGAATKASVSVDNSSKAWWTAFRDDRLSRLIDRGLAENLSIAQAVERINEANAGMIGAGATLLPAASGSITGRETGGSAPSTSSVSYGGSASWMLDLFGQYSNSRRAAEANLDAAYFSADAARLTFLSELTNAYIDLRYYQESLALTRLSLATRRQTLELTEGLLNNGAGSQLDVLQAQSALDAASLQLPSLELGFVRSLNRLATLTAQSSAVLEKDLQKGAPQPWPRARTNAGIPADLIRQRPDIQAAERALFAATANAGIAEAQMYPSITLSGNIQLTSPGNSTSWGFGPTLNLPFLDGGRARANHQAALSQVNQAYLSWQSTVRGAIEETDNALAAVRRDGRSIDAATKVSDSAQRTLQLARTSYKEGQGQILDVLNAERGLFDARAQLAASTRQYATNYVLLNVAIGGGIAALPAGRN